MINYKYVLLVYCPVLLLLLAVKLKDKVEPSNELQSKCNWSLIPGIILIGFEKTNLIAIATLHQILAVTKFQFSAFVWEFLSACSYCLVLILSFTLLRCVYRQSIVSLFELRSTLLLFTLKIAGILSVVNLLSISFLGLNVVAGPLKEGIEVIKSMEPKTFILFGFVSLILAPAAEEIVYRGLLYVPLHRKLGKYGAILFSSLLWSYGHHFSSPSATIGTFIVGLILGWLYERSGSLIPPMVFHAFKNSWILVYYFW
jgi:membrane protease YdiL (CAAX protease family)